MTDAPPPKLVSSLVLFAQQTEAEAAALRKWARALDVAVQKKSWEDVAQVRADLVATAAGLDVVARDAVRKAET